MKISKKVCGAYHQWQLSFDFGLQVWELSLAWVHQIKVHFSIHFSICLVWQYLFMDWNILGFYISRFSNEGQFQTDLFIVYSMLSVVCGIGSFVLYFWNRQNIFNSFLYALPTSGMLAEAVACLIVLYNNHMLLAQTIFDIVFGLLFGIGFYRKAYNKMFYIGTVIIVAVLVFLVVYKPFLLTV